MTRLLRIQKKILVFIFTILALSTIRYLLPTSIYAVCPICTVAVVGGLGLSRWLGIDDAVSSIWIGGLILSSSFWLLDWLHKKDFRLLKQFNNLTISLGVILLMYIIVLVPLKYENIIGHPSNTILGMDKIVFGTIVGTAVFLLGMWADKRIRIIKGGQLFSYQKVVLPVLSLVLASLVVYFYGGYLY